MLGRYDMQKEQERLLMKPPTRAFAAKNAAYADIDTSGWEEYCNREFNYCIKYPAQTWEVSVEDGKRLIDISKKTKILMTMFLAQEYWFLIRILSTLTNQISTT